MSSNWAYSLDSLAAGGVIDFDATAYILDKPARFVGNPQMEDLPMTDISLLPEGTKLKDLPPVDSYNDKSLVQNPGWKKWAFGAIAAAGIGGALYALTKGKLKMPGMKNINMQNIKTFAKNTGSTVLNTIKKPFVWVANKFKKTP